MIANLFIVLILSRSPGTHFASHWPPGAPMTARTALLVDDDPQTTARVRELLPWRQVKLESTANADEAVDCLNRHDYCGLVLNLEMANGSAQKILGSVRRGVPIVVIASSIPEWLRE